MSFRYIVDICVCCCNGRNVLTPGLNIDIKNVCVSARSEYLIEKGKERRKVVVFLTVK